MPALSKALVQVLFYKKKKINFIDLKYTYNTYFITPIMNHKSYFYRSFSFPYRNDLSQHFGETYPGAFKSAGTGFSHSLIRMTYPSAFGLPIPAFLKNAVIGLLWQRFVKRRQKALVQAYLLQRFVKTPGKKRWDMTIFLQCLSVTTKYSLC